jgi:hypothetical protein
MLRVVLLLSLLNLFTAVAAEARLVKVLPHLLDQQGRNAINPSLFDRDAYQEILRQNPEQVSAMRFDVQYKTRGIREPLTLRLEVRGSNTPLGQRHIFETTVKPGGFFARWGRIQLDRATSEKVGSIVAWRATLLMQDQVVAEQQSFLW